MSCDLTIRHARVGDADRDLHVAGGFLVDRPAPGARVVDVQGARVIPGLHDHHIHLAAAAAADLSVVLSPDVLARGGGLAGVLRRARQRQPSGWLRCVDYDLTHSGWIDRHDLDDLDEGPLRVQDRTGSRWVLDTAGLEEVLGGDRPQSSSDRWPEGVERDAAGRATGHLVRLDDWLRVRLPEPASLDWAALGRRLASRGVTSVTDAGHRNDVSSLALLAASPLPQRIRAMTAEPGAQSQGRVVADAVKVVLDDDALPSLDALTRQIAGAHLAGRSVAVHCVTDLQLALALAAGLGPGDRIEHANVVPAGYVEMIREAGVAVCAQPGLIVARGDRYLDEVEGARHDELFVLASLAAAGVPLLGGTDAPSGPLDPWLAIEAAVTRRTAAGAVLGAAEALTREDATRMFWRSDLPGWRPRAVRPNEPGDLVVLGEGTSDDSSHADAVLATLVGGSVIHGAL